MDPKLVSTYNNKATRVLQWPFPSSLFVTLHLHFLYYSKQRLRTFWQHLVVIYLILSSSYYRTFKLLFLSPLLKKKKKNGLYPRYFVSILNYCSVICKITTKFDYIFSGNFFNIFLRLLFLCLFVYGRSKTITIIEEKLIALIIKFSVIVLSHYKSNEDIISIYVPRLHYIYVYV